MNENQTSNGLIKSCRIFCFSKMASSTTFAARDDGDPPNPDPDELAVKTEGLRHENADVFICNWKEKAVKANALKRIGSEIEEREMMLEQQRVKEAA